MKKTVNMFAVSKKLSNFAANIQLMSEQEMNSYRFCSGEEPTDEMLRQIMREVAQEAREKKRALKSYFDKMYKNISANQKK